MVSLGSAIDADLEHAGAGRLDHASLQRRLARWSDVDRLVQLTRGGCGRQVGQGIGYSTHRWLLGPRFYCICSVAAKSEDARVTCPGNARLAAAEDHSDTRRIGRQQPSPPSPSPQPLTPESQAMGQTNSPFGHCCTATLGGNREYPLTCSYPRCNVYCPGQCSALWLQGTPGERRDDAGGLRATSPQQ